MSLENEGIPVSWDEIKKASQKLARQQQEEAFEKRMAREYLADTECEDTRVQEHIAIPGYN